MSDVLIDEGLLADCVLNHADAGRAATNAVSVVGPKTVGALIDKIFAVHSRIRANDRYDKSLIDEYHSLIDLVSSARIHPFIQAVLERAKTEDPEEIFSLADLISRHGRRVERERLTLARRLTNGSRPQSSGGLESYLSPPRQRGRSLPR